jgi:hypothetical protein
MELPNALSCSVKVAAAPAFNTPISTGAGCCARAASGQAAAAPPSNVMNSRRLMGSLLRPRAAHYHTVA